MALDAIRWAFRTPIESSGAKFLLVALAEHARDDGDGWTCFPSIKRLCLWTSQGTRTVERHMSWLLANGWVSRVRRDKRQGDASFVYTLHRENGRGGKALPLDADDVGDEPANSAIERQGVRQAGADHPPFSTKSAARLARPYMEEPVIEPVNEPTPRAARQVDDRFDAFWAAYPNKVEKQGAQALYRRLVRRGEARPDELVAGAQRYAALVRDRAQRFVKSPTSWLTKGCWADGAPSAASVVASPPQPSFEGPADVWSSVATRKGPAWAMSYLAPCAWSAASRALLPRTAFAARKLREELGGLLRDLAVAIIDPTPAMGGVHV